MAELFDWCVGVMYMMADIIGFTYKEINIILFVILHPLITIIQFIIILSLWKKLRHCRKKAVA
ncbi:MAG: hypothetical protein IT216_01010 [Saprospiraceae bacterium]|nr:MAG: hypothetical protein UZ08_BCD001001449 [Candidatus Parvibacillus calidus]MCC7147776.1 hypothetical protein [Saprospiraceae bacterium]WKZ64573.1 MAG: hypothetical protein QY315_07155 [Saprospiraceae bacterium]